jgi:prepilin-type N-terminal cleavage/methylation domain-containing protein
MNNPLHQHATISTAHQQGFTLLEMILVVFIMGTLATISMSFIESEDSQWRYDESLRKMAMVRDAVLKVRDYKSQQIMSGFVFDNGMLPDKTGPFDQLIGPSTLQTFEEKEPYFFYDYGNSSVKLSDLSSNNDIELTLFKGYRAGAYLSSGLDSANNFLDGWGNNFTVSLGSDTYQVEIDSFSRPAPYDKEPKIIIAKHNWSISIAELNTHKIFIDNQISEITGDLSIALFIYQNSTTTGAGEWVVFQSEDEVVIPEGITEYILTKRLIDGNERAITSSDLIPAGTHLLTIIDNTVIDNTVISSAPLPGAITFKTPASLNTIYQKFTLFPGSSLPELKLTIKE